MVINNNNDAIKLMCRYHVKYFPYVILLKAYNSHLRYYDPDFIGEKEEAQEG